MGNATTERRENINIQYLLLVNLCMNSF